MLLFLDANADVGALRHVIRFEGAGANPPESRTTVAGPRVDVDTTPPVLLRAPLRGDGWLAANALSNDADHRRTVAVVDGQARVTQRYAIDLVQLNDKGRAFDGDPSRNESWVGYGAQVMAGVAGEVVALRTDLPDNTPLKPPSIPISLQTIGGNYVVVKMADGSHVFYGHLQPQSVKVKIGDSVGPETVLGRLGNSGQSDAPHLHLHVSDGPSPLGSNGRAFAFESFELRGHVPSLAVLEDAAGWRNPGSARNARSRELPLANAVVDFPD